MIGPLGLLLLVSAAPPAPLVDERVVVVAEDAERGALVEVALRARGLRVLDDAERAGLDGRDTRAAAGDRELARTRLLAARAAWRQLDVDAATRAAAEALAESLRLDRPEDHADLVVDILLLQAALALGADADTDARRPLQLATRLEPEREGLDPALHPPSLVAAWSAARAHDDGVVVVVVRPRVAGGGDAVVLIDGREAAVKDGLLELRRGPHLVTVRAPGCRSQSRVVDAGSEDVAIEDVLVPDDLIAARVAAIGRLAGGDVTALQTLRAGADVDVVVALSVPMAEGRQLLAVRGDAEPVVVAVRDDAAPAAVADAIVRALAPVPATPRSPPPAEPEPWPTGLLVVGAVGATAVVGGALTLTWLLWPGDPPPPPPRPVVLTCCTQ